MVIFLRYECTDTNSFRYCTVFLDKNESGRLLQVGLWYSGYKASTVQYWPRSSWTRANWLTFNVQSPAFDFFSELQRGTIVLSLLN